MATVEAVEGETYFGGLTSPSIRKRRADPRPCGVYATNRRIFLVCAPPGTQVLFLAAWVVVLALLLSALSLLILFPMGGEDFGVWYPLEMSAIALLLILLGSQWYKDSSEVPVQELKRRSIWEISRDQILTVEMNGNDFWTSRIDIHLRSGERRTVFFAERGSFERAKALFPSSNAS
jgi:hypothetical protein